MNYYNILGLPQSASKEEIKRAYRKLAMETHPDKHTHSPQQVKEDATRKFKEVSEAYETLIDDRKRPDYNYQTSYRNSSGYGYSRSDYRKRADYNMREFLLEIALQTAIKIAIRGLEIGAIYAIDAVTEALRKKMRNFETLVVAFTARIRDL